MRRYEVSGRMTNSRKYGCVGCGSGYCQFDRRSESQDVRFWKIGQFQQIFLEGLGQDIVSLIKDLIRICVDLEG